MRGHGKTSFSLGEKRRNQLYSLHHTQVMNTQCYYRNCDTNDTFDFSRQQIGATMAWLKAN